VVKEIVPSNLATVCQSTQHNILEEATLL